LDKCAQCSKLKAEKKWLKAQGSRLKAEKKKLKAEENGGVRRSLVK
jgi:hypothetical protein